MPARADGKSTLSRSRTNRITNKTRLKVLVGTYDVESIVEDGEPIDYHTQGVEAHESTETHLQRALSATTLRVLGGGLKHNEKHAARQAAADAIPIPDASGLAAGSDSLYPPGKFKDHTLHLRFSDTVEESIANGLAGGYTYYMDEEDNTWLQRNNQEARGEGSSSQPARGASSSTPTSRRNGKAKESDPVVAVAMSEDEFELVMGLFERRAADPPFPFLHLDPDSFPAMEVYEEWFETPLSAELFSAYTVPEGVPDSTRLVELARCLYPHWRQRRIMRGGHRIIPQLSTEDPVSNDSYTCFRRRELRPVRRTRRQQDSGIADPMLQLQRELATCLDLARLVAKRETLKQRCVAQNHELADARLKLVQLKRDHRGIGERGDEGLLFDKEQKIRKKKPPPISLSVVTSAPKRTETAPRKAREPAERASPATIVDMPNYAKQRAEEINLNIEKELARQKQEDIGFEDALDWPFQKVPQLAAQRLFKAPSGPGRLLTSAARGQGSPSVRARIGRGGRILLDRVSKPAATVGQSINGPSAENDTARAERLRDRWRFDLDNINEVEGEGNRVIVDEFHTNQIRLRAQLWQPTDNGFYFYAPMESRPSTSASPSVAVTPARSAAGRRRASTARQPAAPSVLRMPSFAVPAPPTASTSAVASSSASAGPSAISGPTAGSSSSSVTAASGAALARPPAAAAAAARTIAPATPSAAPGTSAQLPLPANSLRPPPVPVKTEPRIAPATPAKPRLRLADSDAVQVKQNLRARVKAPEGEAPPNGKIPMVGIPRAGYPHLQGNPVPVLVSRANFTPFMHNGHNGDVPPAANGNGRASPGGTNGTASHSRSPSAESSRAAAASEPASASASESVSGS
ncbi:hypothetical protein AURDEDRAFT_158321 [Auricularia subglabra TFB-10046 SS5]|nr:hypothetical protein AURDEDRAFT_158321 [Auricularia subglabra TFB-10046 SS5]